MSKLEFSKRDTKKVKADTLIASLPEGTEFSAYDLSKKLVPIGSGIDKNERLILQAERSAWRQFLSKYLRDALKEGRLLDAGLKESRAVLKKRMYRKV